MLDSRIESVQDDRNTDKKSLKVESIDLNEQKNTKDWKKRLFFKYGSTNYYHLCVKGDNKEALRDGLKRRTFFTRIYFPYLESEYPKKKTFPIRLRNFKSLKALDLRVPQSMKIGQKLLAECRSLRVGSSLKIHCTQNSQEAYTFFRGIKSLRNVGKIQIGLSSTSNLSCQKMQIPLFKSLKRHKFLQSLNLSFSNTLYYEDGWLKPLGVALSKLRGLKHLSLGTGSDPYFFLPEIDSFFLKLRKLKNLEYLNIEFLKLTHEWIEDLFGCLRSLPHFSTLSIRVARQFLSFAETMNLFKESLKGLTKLSELALKIYRDSSNSEFQKLDSTVSLHDVPLKVLKISSDNNFAFVNRCLSVSDIGAIKTLSSLSLKVACDMKTEIIELTNQIIQIPCLSTLNLRFQRKILTDDLIRILSEGLKRMKSLTSIELVFERGTFSVTPSGIEYLYEALQDLKSLEKKKIEFH